MNLSEIAKRLNGRIDNCPRPDDVSVTGVAGIEEAGPGQITFIANPKYAPAARTTKAAAIIASEDFPSGEIPLLRFANPYLAFARAIELFYKPPRYLHEIHSTAEIASSAKIGKNASIGPYVVIDEDVEVGDNCVLRPHVVIYRGARIGNNFFAHAHAVVREYCRIGHNVILQNGVVIGADGFGFARDGEHWHKIVQSGITILEDDVEVQANSTIDRSSIGETRVSRDAKVDNLVMVGHGSSVGEHSLLCSQVGLAGSTTVGKNVILAGQVGVAGHCTIGDGAIATAQSGIPNDVEPGKTVSGYPAVENKQWLRSVAAVNRLPEIVKQVRALCAKKAE